MAEPPTRRAVTDRDASGLVALIGAAYAEHPGCVLDLPGVDHDLTAPATAAARRGGRWWVIEEDGRLVGSIGTGALHDGIVELKRLYVMSTHRRRGLARELMSQVEAHAAGIGASTVELWSDSRFTDAHQLYAALGYTRTGESRELHDPSETTEYRFVTGVSPLPPRAVATWHGPHGVDTCHLVDLPDGVLLEGKADRIHYRVEVDAAWRTRVAEVADPTGSLRLTADGGGRWWREGRIVTTLAGCLDADVEATAATKALPIRRVAALGPATDHEVVVAQLRVPGPDVLPIEQRYTRLADERWGYRSDGVRTELSVDRDGLPIDLGDLWRRA